MTARMCAWCGTVRVRSDATYCSRAHYLAAVRAPKQAAAMAGEPDLADVIDAAEAGDWTAARLALMRCHEHPSAPEIRKLLADMERSRDAQPAETELDRWLVEVLGTPEEPYPVVT